MEANQVFLRPCLFFALSLAACGSIKTRKDLQIQGIELQRSQAAAPQRAASSPVVVKQVESVAAETKASELGVDDPVSLKLQMSEQIRKMSGELQDLKDLRAEELRLWQEREQKLELRLGQIEAKMAVYEQSIAQLETELQHLKTLKTAAPVAKLGVFETAEQHMAAKSWRRAILEFENYRKKYPKGRRVDMATYLIGVCFQELKLNEEAKAFYRETIEKFPKTEAARKAKYRLGQMK